VISLTPRKNTEKPWRDLSISYARLACNTTTSLGESFAGRLIHALRMQHKRGKIANTGKESGAIVWKSIAWAYVDLHRLFARGEMMRLCKESLASGPKTTKELALIVIAAKGLEF
jgi:hypothetical protein